MKFSLFALTCSAAQQQIYGVYDQIQICVGRDIDSEQWELNNKKIQRVTIPAPYDILNTIFCNCIKGCDGKCGCT